MAETKLTFDHIHLISEDPRATAEWYASVLGATVRAEHELRGAPQIQLALGGMTLLVRGKRPGESPTPRANMRGFDGYSSHNVWGTDHFGFIYHGDLHAFCEEIRAKGATFAVEPWEFAPGTVLCYVNAPDGVTIELVRARTG
jgi:catechol 2,3-dioxygenase-like lactoylglutathione lyase family enzyme